MFFFFDIESPSLRKRQSCWELLKHVSANGTTPRYNWNIAKIDVKHQLINK